MLDAVAPAAEVFAAALASGVPEEVALDKMKRAAWQGAESTKNMQAKRGRASNQAEKGIGCLDPGAVTMAIKLECLGDYLQKHCL